jgi:hypothetical protein
LTAGIHTMEDSLYDEFGNFVGTVDSDAESDVDKSDLEARADVYLREHEDEEEEEDPASREGQMMQVDGKP